jgi:hypothetical protein
MVEPPDPLGGAEKLANQKYVAGFEESYQINQIAGTSSKMSKTCQPFGPK